MPDDNKRKDEPQLDAKALQQRILRGVKSDTGEKTGKWVMNLTDGVSDKVDIPTQFDEAKASQFPDEMRSWIDKIFDEFQRYQHEYNRSQTNNDLLIDSERPVYSHAAGTSGSVKYQQTQGQQYFQGHLYTKKYALIVRGHELQIKAWAIPVDVLIGFETVEADFTPYLEMRGAKNNRGLTIWHIDAVPISYEALSAIAKALFSAMVKASKGELKQGERFTLADAAKEVETDTAQFMQRYTMPSDNTALLKPDDLEPPPPPPQRAPLQGYPPQQSMPGYAQPGYSMPGNSTGYSPAPHYQQPPYPNAAAQNISQGYPQQQLMPGYPGQQQNQQMPQQNQQMPQQNQGQPYANVSGQPNLGNQISAPHPQQGQQPAQGMSSNSDLLNKALDENVRQLMASCQAQAQTIFMQLDVLSKIGIAALQTQDMEVVNTIMVRTNSIKAFKDQMDNFVRELNNQKPAR